MSSNISEERKKFLSLFATDRFTDDDLIGLLLPYMNKNGVPIVEEDELSIKLYPYYRNLKYKELFSDICKQRYSDKVDLYDGMYGEKYFGGHIWWVDDNKELHLNYGPDYNSWREENVKEELRLLLKEIADDLSLRYKIESTSKHRLNIYNLDQNKTYKIVEGKKFSCISGWELITDGEIKDLRSIPYSDDQYFDDPNNYYVAMNFDKFEASYVEIADASYTIMQGVCNGRIKNLKVYTDIRDLDILKQISDYANEIHTDEASLLTKAKPYIRKLTLR